MNEERSRFGGWEPRPGKPGEYRPSMVSGPVTPGFVNFTKQAEVMRDLGEWLKVKLRQLLNKGTPIK